MKKIFYISLCIVLIIIGCEEENNPVVPDPSPQFVLAENTVQSDSNNFKSDLLSLDSAQIVFNTSSNFAQSLKTNGFIVSDYGKGILRKIESIQIQGSQMIVKTRQARLDEVILEGTIEFSGPINPQEMKLISTSHNNFIIEKTQVDLFVSFNDITLSGASNLKINASTKFSNPNLTFIIKFKKGVTTFQSYLEVTNESSIKINTTGNVSVSGEYIPPWAEFWLPPIPTPLIVPVIPKVVFGIGGDVNIEGISTNELTLTTNTKAGFQLLNMQPSPIFEVNSTGIQATSNLENLGSSFKNYLIFPKVGFYVVGLLGPFYNQQAYAKGNVSLDNAGKYIRMSWGLQGDAGIEFDLFGLLQAGINFPLYDTDWELWKNYFPTNLPNTPTLLTPLNGATNISIPATLSWNPSSDAASYALQVSTSSNFTSFLYNQSGLIGTSQQLTGLNNQTTYYWRVSATNSYGTSGWSSVWNFTTASGGTTQGLVAYYPFNGNANDESGSGNHATTNTAILTSDRYNQSNSAYTFNGTTRILAPTNNLPIGNSDRTISVWVHSPNFGQGNKMFVGWGTPGSPNLRMSALGIGHSFSTNKKPFFWGWGADLVAVTPLNDNNWNHVACVFNNGVMKIYINGQLDNYTNLTINTPPNTTLHIGWFNSTLSGFNGSIDDIRIYNRALTDSEILGLYNE